MTDRIIVMGWIYRSRQNGVVVSVYGLSPTLSVGHHSGVEPRCVWYEDI